MVDLFSTRSMMNAIELMDEPSTFFLDMFFPLVEEFDTEAVDIDITHGEKIVAPFVRPTEESMAMEQEGQETRSYKPPYVKPKRVTRAGQFLKRGPGMSMYPGDSPMKRAAAKLGKDIAWLINTVWRRMEVMAAEIVRTGQLTVDWGTYKETLDFKQLVTHIITLAGADLWTADTSDPIGDIRVWKKLVTEDSGYSPDFGLMGTSVLNAFLAHADVRALLDNRRITIGNMQSPRPVPRGAEYVGTIEGIEWYTYDKTYKDPATGTQTRYLPETRLIIGASDADNHKLFGAIEDDDVIRPTRFHPTSWKENDPPKRMVMLQSAPLPALNVPASVVSVKPVAA